MVNDMEHTQLESGSRSILHTFNGEQCGKRGVKACPFKGRSQIDLRQISSHVHRLAALECKHEVIRAWMASYWHSTARHPHHSR